MAIVYGYFSDEESAKQAAIRCEELGVSSAVLTSMEAPSFLKKDSFAHSMRVRETFIMRSGLIGALVFGLLGFLTWFVIPGLHQKLFLAGPLMMAMFGSGIGIIAGMILEPQQKPESQKVLGEVLMHPAADRVVIINTENALTTINIEELLEREGAIEVIHRAA